MTKKHHPHLDDPRAMSVFKAAWNQWGDVMKMHRAVGVSYAVLYRRYDQGLLPPETLWLEVLRKAKANNSLLRTSDLLWFADRLRDAA